MFIVVNTIEAEDTALSAMTERFERVAHELRQFEGFLGFELWRRPGALIAVSRWRSREAFAAYPKSEMFKRHHRGHSSEELEGRANLSYYEGDVIA